MHLDFSVPSAGYLLRSGRVWPRQVPKQYGGLSEFLQPHMKNVPLIGATNSMGSIEVPWCESSHQGWVELRPQLHHRYRFPSSTISA